MFDVRCSAKFFSPLIKWPSLLELQNVTLSVRMCTISRSTTDTILLPKIGSTFIDVSLKLFCAFVTGPTTAKVQKLPIDD